jgi:hypothetical protein
MRKEHPFGGDAIEGRCFDDLVSIGAGVRPSPVVRQGKKDVRPGVVRPGGHGRGAAHRYRQAAS